MRYSCGCRDSHFHPTVYIVGLAVMLFCAALGTYLIVTIPRS